MANKEFKEGQEFAAKPKKVSWERLWTFSGGPFAQTGWPKSNLHTDLEFAKKCGLPSVAASGTQHQGHVVQLMIDLFGMEWLSHGTMDVKFIGVVDAGDMLTARAVIKSVEAHNRAKKYTMDVWVDNQRGEKMLVGSTTAIA